MIIETLPVNQLTPYDRNTVTHPESQILEIMNSIVEFGFVNPIGIDKFNNIVFGHGRLIAAMRLGMTEVPCVRLGHLSERQVRAYRIADNKIARNSQFDFEALAAEVDALAQMDFDLELIGFDEQELSALLQDNSGIFPDDKDGINVKAHKRKASQEAKPPEVPKVICKVGEVWILGNHKLAVGEQNGECDAIIKYFESKTEKTAYRESDGQSYSE